MADSNTYRDDPDVQLMLEFQGGDERAFRTLYDRYKRPVFVWIYRMVRKPERAEELTQEVFIRVYRAKERYKAEARFRTWLYTIAARLAFNERRQQKRSVEDLALESEAGESPIDRAEDVKERSPLEVVEASRLHEAIARFLSQLPERQRAALMLRYFEELSHDEISDILGVRKGAVKSLLHRGLVNLEAILRQSGHPESGA